MSQPIWDLAAAEREIATLRAQVASLEAGYRNDGTLEAEIVRLTAERDALREVVAKADEMRSTAGRDYYSNDSRLGMSIASYDEARQKLEKP